jgi:hypothetical protein
MRGVFGLAEVLSAVKEDFPSGSSSVCLYRGCGGCSSFKHRKQLNYLLSSILLLSRYVCFNKMADVPSYTEYSTDSKHSIELDTVEAL